MTLKTAVIAEAMGMTKVPIIGEKVAKLWIIYATYDNLIELLPQLYEELHGNIPEKIEKVIDPDINSHLTAREAYKLCFKGASHKKIMDAAMKLGLDDVNDIAELMDIKKRVKSLYLDENIMY